VGIDSRLDQGLGTGANPPREAHDAENQATDHDDRLHDIGPDYSFHAAEEGIEDSDHPHDDDDQLDRPVQELVQEQAYEVEDHRGSTHDVEQEGQRRINPAPGADPLFEKLVDAQQLHLPVVRYGVSAGQPGHREDRQREDERMPVGVVRFARRGDVRDAAGVRAHDGQPRRPGGNGSPGHHELLRRAALAGVVDAHPDDHDAVRRQDRDVEGPEVSDHSPSQFTVLSYGFAVVGSRQSGPCWQPETVNRELSVRSP